MINVFNKIVLTLSPLGYSIREQGSYGQNENLPETFITYFILNSPDISFADNLPTARTTQVQISLYSKKPNIVQSADATIKNLMRSAGFLRLGGRSLPFEPVTGHYCWTQDYRLYETEE